MMGTFNNIFMVGVCNLGRTAFFIIFSIIRGTAITMWGFTSANAWKIKAIPYMWAMGSMDTMLLPDFNLMASLANNRLDNRERKGNITPLDMPVLPEV